MTGIEYTAAKPIFDGHRSTILRFFKGVTINRLPALVGSYTGIADYNHGGHRCRSLSYSYDRLRPINGGGSAGSRHDSCRVQMHIPAPRCTDDFLVFGRHTLALQVGPQETGDSYFHDEALAITRLPSGVISVTNDVNSTAVWGGTGELSEANPAFSYDTSTFTPETATDLGRVVAKVPEMIASCIKPWLDAGRPLVS